MNEYERSGSADGVERVGLSRGAPPAGAILIR
jgi:hypothetical protein